tara:strand:+ start:2589 stop:2753 length:165 start_codon:yes stop_codon:yes gene_type:complete
MKDERECQNIECVNIGTKVRVGLDMEDGSKRVEDIFLCNICIGLQRAINGGLKN